MNSQVNIYTGEKGRQYYQVSTGDVFYDINFPLNIALECSDINSIMGPNNCNNCRIYGSYNDITLLLCLNCVEICSAHKHERCACDDLQSEIDDQLQHFNADGDDGFMCMGCDYGSKCNLNTWYSDMDFSTISLSYEHHELVSYKEFMRLNKYENDEARADNLSVDNDRALDQVFSEYISYVEPDTDTESSASSIDCLSSSSAEDMSSIFSIEDEDYDIIDVVGDRTFQYEAELLKQFPLAKKELEIAKKRRDVEETQFEEYDYLQWHYERLNKEYNSSLFIH